MGRPSNWPVFVYLDKGLARTSCCITSQLKLRERHASETRSKKQKDEDKDSPRFWKGDKEAGGPELV